MNADQNNSIQHTAAASDEQNTSNLSEKSIAISVKNLNFYYSNKIALKNINLEIKKNKITALIGASGSGKSTLIRTLNQIYRLYEDQKVDGEIWFNSNNINKKKTDLNKLRTSIGMVSQKPTPFPMSIFDNIAFAIKLHKKINKKEISTQVEKALKQAALWDEVKFKLHTDAAELSGGQQQRLCIARTIAINPEIILFDEPTAALDPISTQKIEQLIKKLSKNYTVVIVTHNMTQARHITDYTAYLAQGELVECLPTQLFFTTPNDTRSREFIFNAEHS